MKKNKLEKNILVIGGSGFLGTHIIDVLCEKKFKVTNFDKNKNKWNNPNANNIIANANNLKKLESQIKKNKIIIHLAGISDLNYGLKNPIETFEQNILTTINILKLCVKYKVKHFVYSSSVYTDSKEGGFYKCSKIATEEYIKEFSKTYNLKYSILKYGSLYGTRSNENNALYRIIKKAIIAKKIEYIGNPKSIREYINVKDAAYATYDIIKNNLVNKNIVLKGPDKFYVDEILKIIKEIMSIKSNIKYKKSSYPGHYLSTPYSYDVNENIRYNSNLSTDIGQGLIDLIKYIQNELKNNE